METKYRIDGMSCAGCARKIELALVNFAESARVDFEAESLSLTGLRGTHADLNAKLAGIGGYRLLPIELTQSKSQQFKPYYPLTLIIGYIAVVSLADADNASIWMRHFMAGFFLVFSFFKLLNLNKFADSYGRYDLLAMRWRAYGKIYPFIELGLGLAYLFSWHLGLVLWLTFAVTAFSSLGVLRLMSKKQIVRCACLGGILNVPVSTITLIEDVVMTVMALAMLAA
jgi:copper chaperone CopZ